MPIGTFEWAPTHSHSHSHSHSQPDTLLGCWRAQHRVVQLSIGTTLRVLKYDRGAYIKALQCQHVLACGSAMSAQMLGLDVRYRDLIIDDDQLKALNVAVRPTSSPPLQSPSSSSSSSMAAAAAAASAASAWSPTHVHGRDGNGARVELAGHGANDLMRSQVRSSPPCAWCYTVPAAIMLTRDALNDVGCLPTAQRRALRPSVCASLRFRQRARLRTPTARVTVHRQAMPVHMYHPPL
jgi:hypothetical protein